MTPISGFLPICLNPFIRQCLCPRLCVFVCRVQLVRHDMEVRHHCCLVLGNRQQENNSLRKSRSEGGAQVMEEIKK